MILEYWLILAFAICIVGTVVLVYVDNKILTRDLQKAWDDTIGRANNGHV